MKHCHVVLIDFYADGHHAPYIFDLVTGLRDLGVRVTVIGPSELQNVGSDQFIALKGCERLKALEGMRRQRAAFPVCRKAIANAMAVQPTHIHFLYADFHVGAIAMAWHLHQPAATPVLTAHWVKGVGGGNAGVKNWIRRAPHRFALRCLTRQKDARILVHHETAAKDISRIISSKKIGVIPYPTRPIPEVKIESRLHFRQTLGVGPEEKLILCYGGMRFDKGADLAVKALARIPDRFHLLFAGKPSYFQPEYLRQQAKGLGADDRLHVIPKFLSDAETALVFHACDIVLIPYREIFSGQSGPMTQAAAIGKTIVAADLPVLKETVRKYGLGTVFPAGNIGKMVEAVQAVEEYNSDPMSVRAFVEDHSPQAFSEAVYENYYLEPVGKELNS